MTKSQNLSCAHIVNWNVYVAFTFWFKMCNPIIVGFVNSQCVKFEFGHMDKRNIQS